MKWFYITSVALVAALSFSPLATLRQENLDFLAGKAVSYRTYGAKVKSIDPATCGDTTSADIQGEIYESLYTYHYLKRPLEVIPQLADGMPRVSPDRLTYAIRIRPDATYRRNPCFGTRGDGSGRFATRAVTAADFVLQFKRIADYHIETDLAFAFISDKIVGVEDFRSRTKGYAKGDLSRYWKEDLAGVKALDDRTLEIRLTSPWPQLLYVLAINNYAPMPREAIEYHLMTRPRAGAAGGAREPIPPGERDPEIREPAAAVGTGAYWLAEWVKGSKIVLMRNEDYRDVRYPTAGEPGDAERGLLRDAGRRLPLVDVQYLTFVAEDNPMWMLFMTKQADAAGIPTDLYSQVITPGKTLTDAWVRRGINLRKSTSPVVYWLAFNMQDRVLGASRSLRQALNLCFDVEQYIDVLHNGRGVRAVTYVPTGFEGRSDAPSPYARYDLAAARAKLAQARRELAEAGVIAPGGSIPPLVLDTSGRSEYFRRLGEFVQREFRKIGLEVKVELNDWPTLQQKVHRKLAQVYTMGWHADYPDPENFLQLYYSPNIKRGTNNTNFSNAEFDRLYEQIAVMMPSPRRTELYVRMLQILNEECPVLLLSEPISYSLRWNWVLNGKPHPIGYGLGKYIRIDADARRRAGGR